MTRTRELSHIRGKIDILENNISFFASIPSVPKKLLRRAKEEKKAESIIAHRAHMRNKNPKGRKLKRILQELDEMEPLFKEIDKEVHHGTK